MNSNKIILAGDIGGTKTLLALFECNGKRLIEIKTKKYVSRVFENLEIIINNFLEEQEVSPLNATFGIPGPVVNGIVKSTNLPWIIDEKILSKHTKIPKVKIVNDLG